MHLTILLITTALLMSSCSDENEVNRDYESLTDRLSDSNGLRYLALGDSYTIGEGVQSEEKWPYILTDNLERAGFNMDDPQIIARTGWTTGDLKLAIDQTPLRGQFDLVSLLIGVNNQYRGVSRGYTIDDYRDELSELIQEAIDFAGGYTGRVFVVSIPDYSVTPFVSDNDKSRVSSEIDRYNAVKKEVAESFDVKYFDITPVSRLAADDLQLLASDGLHPSGKMYRMWVDLMIEDILKML